MRFALAGRLAAVNDRLVHAAVEFEFANVRAAAGDHDAALADAEVRTADVALAALHSVRDVTSARVAETITNLCSEALRLVFDDPSLRLEARSVERRSVIETDLVLCAGDLETDPMQSNGGGAIAVMSAILRLVLVRLMSRRSLMPLLVLDEPLAALSEGHREQMARVLHDVAADLGVQVIVVTHSEPEMLGTVYRVQWADQPSRRAEVVLSADI